MTSGETPINNEIGKKPNVRNGVANTGESYIIEEIGEAHTTREGTHDARESYMTDEPRKPILENNVVGKNTASKTNH